MPDVKCMFAAKARSEFVFRDPALLLRGLFVRGILFGFRPLFVVLLLLSWRCRRLGLFRFGLILRRPGFLLSRVRPVIRSLRRFSLLLRLIFGLGVLRFSGMVLIVLFLSIGRRGNSERQQ